MSDEQQDPPVEDTGADKPAVSYEPTIEAEAEVNDTAEEEVVNEREDHGFVQDPTTGTVRNKEGRVVYARPGTVDAAVNGVQEDASGHMTSANFTHSDKSNTRI